MKQQQHMAFLSMINDISGIPVSSMPYRGYALIGSESDVKEIQMAQSTGRPLWYICSGNYIQSGNRDLVSYVRLVI